MAVTLQQPVTSSVSDSQQHHKMSIAFLAGQVNECMEMIDSHDAFASAPSLVSVAEPTLQMPYQDAERSETPITLPPLRLGGSPYSNGPHFALQLSRISSPSSMKSYGSTHSANCWGGRYISYYSNTASNFSSTNTSPSKRRESIWKSDSTILAPTLATSYHAADFFSNINNAYAKNYHYPLHHHSQPTPASVMAEYLPCVPHLARPSHNEEQKFFIIYYRVIKELSWPKSEDRFALSSRPVRTAPQVTAFALSLRRATAARKVRRGLPFPKILEVCYHSPAISKRPCYCKPLNSPSKVCKPMLPYVVCTSFEVWMEWGAWLVLTSLVFPAFVCFDHGGGRCQYVLTTRP
jgi:hypothetical protein